jgi:tartrate-resistant acid phosphatase type 5
MPDFFSEPFLQLAGLTHKSALIAWGAFYFRVKGTEGDFKLVDDGSLKHVHPPRHESIGARSEPYGPARVEVRDKNGSLVTTAVTLDTNHAWVTDLAPDTEYTYKVMVNDDEWAEGQRRDWVIEGGKSGLRPGGRYDNRFRTHPDPTRPAAQPLSFAVIGDFGTGVKSASKVDRRQREVALALEQAAGEQGVRLILTTGDNIYAGKKLFNLLPIGSQGDEDDDWYFTYYQPYRYIINRIPVYPSIGNHDAGETEERDDRGQVFDNFYIKERTDGEDKAGRASIDPGLFYRFGYGSDIEFVCIDTSKEPDVFQGRLFDHPKHQPFLRTAFKPRAAGETGPRWRIPFCHHPPFSAGPQHVNTKGMDGLLRLFAEAGVRVVLSGHEHNFQHSETGGVHFFVTGGGGKFRDKPPKEFKEAHTRSWCAACHFLVATIDGPKMTVQAFGEAGGAPRPLTRSTPDGKKVETAMEVSL